MSEQKCEAVLDLYETVAEDMLTRAKALNMEVADYKHLRAAEKILDMIPRARELLVTPGKREKLMRWIGFMQGCWFIAGVYTLEDLKNHSKPDDEEYRADV